MKHPNKKGAMELTMGTMVTIVLIVAALILGLVLIQKIFTGATQSVDDINAKVMSELNSLFSDQNSNVIVYLDKTKTAKFRVGSDSLGVAIAARTPDGSKTDTQRLQYRIRLDEDARENCVTTLGATKTANLIDQKLDTWLDFDRAQDDTVGAAILFTIPDGTALCKQKIYVDVKDVDNNEDIGTEYFILEILRKIL